MSDFITRRKLVTSSLVAAAGIAGLDVAARIADKYGFLAPDHSGILGAGEALTYGAQRILISHHSLAREFDRSQISNSKIIPVNGEPPETDVYQRDLANGFADWRLTVDGLVERPSAFSLAELKSFPSRSQITHQACEEGWSFIAEWSGVPLSYVLHLVGVRPEAKWVVFFTLDDIWDSIDMPEAFHPQTLLAFGMNGQELPAKHGAPLRVRVPRQLGQKSKKYLSRIFITDTVKNIGKGLGAIDPEQGFSWYMGI
jgi:DMSO/TMAO reductase YedYZ molybdopterin-dependent catalytic subunit